MLSSQDIFTSDARVNMHMGVPVYEHLYVHLCFPLISQELFPPFKIFYISIF